MQYPLPEKVHRVDVNEGSSSSPAEWLHTHCSKAEVGFVNQGTDLMELYWVNGDQRQPSGELDIGEKNSRWIQTFIGHQFAVVNTRTLDETLVTVEHDGFHVLGSAPPPVVVEQDFRENLDDRIRMTVQEEWRKSRKVTRTFTGLGFSKGRLPPDLWASLSAYHYNNRAHMMREEWGGKGLFVNWWDVDARMIGMPWDLKKYWQARLKRLVEAWSGVELELTDIYGMRQYEAGARLLMHVDRINTHAASLIINVDREPWLLQIYDFADRLCTR